MTNRNRNRIGRGRVDSMTMQRRHLQEQKRQLLQRKKKIEMGLVKAVPDPATGEETLLEVPFKDIEVKK